MIKQQKVRDYKFRLVFFRPFGEVTVFEKSTSVDVILSKCPEEVPKRWAGDTMM